MVTDCYGQLIPVKTRYPLTAVLNLDLIEVMYFLKSTTEQVNGFRLDRGQVN